MLTIQDFKALKTKEQFINLLKAKQPEDAYLRKRVKNASGRISRSSTMGC